MAVNFVLSDHFWPSMLYVLKGVPLTLAYAFTSLVLGLILAFFLALGRQSSFAVLRCFTKVYISIMRGTPLLVQLSIIYFGLPQVFDFDISSFKAGVCAFTLNAGAYMAEVIRAGIRAVDIGQYEAASALHIPRWLMWRDIVLPQAIRVVLPACLNEAITLVKETAILSFIGELDLTRRAQIIAAKYYVYMPPLIATAVFYYAITRTLESLNHWLERRLSFKIPTAS